MNSKQKMIMKIKATLLRSSAVILMLLLISRISFAQASTQNVETVIYKLTKIDYEKNQKGIKESLTQINGVTVSKFCNLYNKVFLILVVNRTVQPNDNNIINSFSSFSIGYKKIEGNIQDIVTACN